jgi:dihydrofolate reductase
MGQVRFSISVSLDGFMAGPDQRLEEPLGTRGEELHRWAFAVWQGAEDASAAILAEATANVGAYILGRKMFGGGPGDWGDGSWKGWWGDDPPFHAPVFVVTHHARDPQPMEGGTTFHFVTDGIESALAQARAAASDRDIVLGGGADLVQQYLRAGLVDEIQVSVVPILLGSGERLLDGLDGAGIELEPLRVVDAPGVTHLKYRVVSS